MYNYIFWDYFFELIFSFYRYVFFFYSICYGPTGTIKMRIGVGHFVHMIYAVVKHMYADTGHFLNYK